LLQITRIQTLVQQYLFIPAKWKDCYLAYLLDEFKGQSTIIFVATCNNALRITLLLRNLGFNAVCLHGQLSQPKRLGALNKFKSGQRNILVATDVASRGLDIPNVDIVLNFDIPSHGKDYVHRLVCLNCPTEYLLSTLDSYLSKRVLVSALLISLLSQLSESVEQLEQGSLVGQ
jgi:reverse gyrase